MTNKIHSAFFLKSLKNVVSSICFDNYNGYIQAVIKIFKQANCQI